MSPNGAWTTTIPAAYKKFAAEKPSSKGPVVLPDAKEYPYVARGGSWDDDAENCCVRRRGRPRTPSGACRTRSARKASGGTRTPRSSASGSFGRSKNKTN